MIVGSRSTTIRPVFPAMILGEQLKVRKSVLADCYLAASFVVHDI